MKDINKNWNLLQFELQVTEFNQNNSRTELKMELLHRNTLLNTIIDFHIPQTNSPTQQLTNKTKTYNDMNSETSNTINSTSKNGTLRRNNTQLNMTKNKQNLLPETKRAATKLWIKESKAEQKLTLVE